jgi:hypothetical protein
MNDKIKQIFSAQLEKAAICSGNYLEGRSKEALFQDWLPMLRGGDVREKVRHFEEVLNKKIAIWESRAGQKELYFMIETTCERPQVMKIWECDLENLDDSCDIDLSSVRYIEGSTIPVFKGRTAI